MKISSALNFKKSGGDDSNKRFSAAISGIDLESAFDVVNSEPNFSNMTDAQVTAGLAVQSMFNGSVKFDMEGYSHLTSSVDAISAVRSHGYKGSSQRPSGFDLESYSGDTRDRFVEYSVDFNAGAARQDEFGEEFFRTIVVASDIDAVNLEITLPVVYDRYTHKPDSQFAYHQRTVIHALVDPTILKSSVTKLIPVVSAEAAAYFVDNAVIANKVLAVDNQTVTTNYLVPGTEVPLLAITNRPNALGNHEITDTIDGIRLKTLAYRIGGTGSNVLVHNVSKAPTAAFLRRENGKENDLVLNTSELTMILDENTTLANGTKLNTVTGFTGLGDTLKSVRISYKLSGQVNSQVGVATVVALSARPKIQRVVDINGDTIVAPTALADAIATMSFYGWEPDANLDNKNRRQAGKLIDAHTFKDRYQILFGQPLTTQRSTFNKPDEGHKGVQALVDTQRATNSNNAVFAILDSYEALQTFGAEDASVNLQALDEIPGIARRIMKPWAKSKDVDVLEHVQTLRSSDVRADISALLLNQLSSQIFAAYNNSWYSAALSHYSNNSGGAQQRPRVIIGTTPEIAAYLNQIGDARLLGDLFETKVVVTPNVEMAGLIVWTFGQAVTGDASPLESGWFFWSPELLGDINISSNGQTSSEVICIPRAIHVKNTPIVGMINVSNLDLAVSTKIEFKVTTCCDEEETPPVEEPETP